jgi:hypothetical protein
MFKFRDPNNRLNIFHKADYTVVFLKFLTTHVLDFPELYDNCIMGTNMEPILKYTIGVDPKDANIVIAYGKFLDALAQCVLSRNKQLTKDRMEDAKMDEKQLQLKRAAMSKELNYVEQCIKLDMVGIMKAVNGQIDYILRDGLQVYKNTFESVAEQLCSTGLQIVHELMLQEAELSKAKMKTEQN